MNQTFLSMNRRLSARVGRVWPYDRTSSIGATYVRHAAAAAAEAVPARVVDVGAGRDTPYVRHLPSPDRPEILGVDVLAHDLAVNDSLDGRIVADVAAYGLPPQAHGAGLVTSRMVMEHVRDIDLFAASVYEALAPGGQTVHLFAARFSVFAVLNRLLPDAASRRLLFHLRPESREVGGFPTHYDRTHSSGAVAAFERAGFVDVVTEVSYEVSPYFSALTPLFIGARVWESAIRRARLENLGSYVLLSARRPADREIQRVGR
jgi:hypothetical protein